MDDHNIGIKKINERQHDLKITILLGIIIGALIYGSIKFTQMGGINP